MSTVSGEWTDPKAGGIYQDGARMPSADWNSWIGGIRSLDTAVTLQALRNWDYVTNTGSFTPTSAAYDELSGNLIVVGATGGAPDTDRIGYMRAVDNVAPFAPGLVTGLTDVAADSLGNIVTGGTTSGINSFQFYYSTDGGGTYTQGIGPTTDQHVHCVNWFPAANVFVGLMGAGTGTARIVISTTKGVNWGTRLNPLSNTTWTSRTSGNLANNSSICLAFTGATGTTCAYSTDALTWSSTTLPSSDDWIGAAYTAKFGWLAVSGATYTFAESTDGQIWTVASIASAPTGCAAIQGIHSKGNVYVLRWSDGTSDLVSASVDGGATWEALGTSNGVSRAVGVMTGGRYVWIDPAPTATTYLTDRVYA